MKAPAQTKPLEKKPELTAGARKTVSRVIAKSKEKQPENKYDIAGARSQALGRVAKGSSALSNLAKSELERRQRNK